MFGGMFQKKPSKEEALKKLRSHGLMFGAWVVAIRVTPYVLQYFQKDELTLVSPGEILRKKGDAQVVDKTFSEFCKSQHVVGQDLVVTHILSYTSKNNSIIVKV